MRYVTFHLDRQTAVGARQGEHLRTSVSSAYS